MFAELKRAIEVRGRVRNETPPGEPLDIIDLHRELDQAREIVKTLLLSGQVRLRKGLGHKVIGWIATKHVYFPRDDDPDQSNRYLIVATANFPKPVSYKERQTALNSTKLEIAIHGDYHTTTHAVLHPTDALYDSRGYDTRVNLAYAREVIEMIRRDPYVAKQVLVPNSA